MLYKLLKSTTAKLFILVCTIFFTLIISALLFNSQVAKLKKQIDNIYFGNFIPIVKLHLIKDEFQVIIDCKKNNKACDYSKEKTNITEEWNYYFNAYKKPDEKVVVDSINEDFEKAFSQETIELFSHILARVDFLIKYEMNQAFKQRKNFVEDYENMQDYLFYNIVLILILAFLIVVFIVLQIIKKDKQLTVLNKKYKIDSITDSLTELYNRKHFDNIFDNMPFIANANNWYCAFIMLDIDYFKQYNDTYGHDAGDEALKQVSYAIKEYFSKKFEFVFRLGGEEFGVILFDIDKDILEICLKEINKRVVKLQIEHKNSKMLDVISISAGAVIYEPNSYVSGNRLYKLADESLYKAKQNGRNQYHIYKKED